MTAASLSVTAGWIFLALVAGLPVEVHRTDGEKVEGELAGVAESAIVLERSGERSELPFDSIVSLEATDELSRSSPPFRVVLAGGTELASHAVTLADDQLTVELARQDPLVIPVQRVESIRFRAASPATDSQWLGIVESEASGDVLAIRREGDRLDQVQGVVGSIADGVVHFTIDGSDVRAPLERLEGVVFGSVESDASRASVQVIDGSGSRWMVDRLQPSGVDEPLVVAIAGDLTHPIPLSQIASIRWNSSLSLLASQPAAQRSFQPFLAVPGQASVAEKWFAPASDGDEDLLLYGDATLEYRVEPGFEQLTGSVRRDGEVRRGGRVNVSIWLDGKEAWSETLDHLEPRGFSLPLGDARRVQFRVDTAEDGDLGDTVRIIRPRLLK